MEFKKVKFIFVFGAIYLSIIYLVNVYKRVRHRNIYNSKNKPLIIKVLIIFFVVGVIFASTLEIKITKISGKSMEPTIHDNQWIIEKKVNDNIERGDIVTLYTDEKEYRLIKRIIGKGGETIEIKENNIYIDGKKLKENYKTKAFVKDFDLLIIPKNEYFVIGDNRPISLDSRYGTVGTIKENQIDGSVIVY